MCVHHCYTHVYTEIRSKSILSSDTCTQNVLAILTYNACMGHSVTFIIDVFFLHMNRSVIINVVDLWRKAYQIMMHDIQVCEKVESTNDLSVGK